MIPLEKAYSDCHQIILKNSKTFAKAFDLLPEKKRRAVWAVYAFCRTADDIVDEGTNKEKEWKNFRDELIQFFEGNWDRSSSLWTALNDVFTQFPMERYPFLDMLEGQHWDLVKTRYKTLEEVETYGYYVAGTVGLMLLPILSPQGFDHLKQGAVSLGTAMQLTNILRDIGEDLYLNRIYFPEDIMKKHHYSPEQLKNKEKTSSFIQAWEEVAVRAEDLYKEGLISIEEYPEDARFPVKASAYMYWAILHAARKNEYNVFQQRMVVSNDDKKNILKTISG
ncbi:phytoene/squalene synthase family protein [Sinobaca sp. H24]|uniref:phytoene/squalene synthase family protein n=1 Tax=Sinobaca sp. H24 TaxID=2923376 RepID=UPI00207ABF59|nr:phytoene/squalene synthase family protein [Sinobaca sp. H24]